MAWKQTRNSHQEENKIEAEIENRRQEKLKELNIECQKLKTQFKSAQCDGYTLLQSFATDSTFEWGKGNPKAEVALKSVLDIKLSQFEAEFMMMSFQLLKKKYGTDHLIDQLETFKSKKQSIDTITSIVAKLLRMHASSQGDETTV